MCIIIFFNSLGVPFFVSVFVFLFNFSQTHNLPPFCFQGICLKKYLTSTKATTHIRKTQRNSSRQKKIYEDSAPEGLRFERNRSTKKAAEAACLVFSSSIRGRCAGQ